MLLVLSIVAAIPGSFFFFIYGGLSFFVMRKYDRKHGYNKSKSRCCDIVHIILNTLFIVVGVVACLGLGSWASVNTYITAISSGQAQKPFSCQPVVAIEEPADVPGYESSEVPSATTTEQPVNEKIWGEDEYQPLAISETTAPEITVTSEFTRSGDPETTAATETFTGLEEEEPFATDDGFEEQGDYEMAA